MFFPGGGAPCSFEPVQVVCPQRREAHVVAAGAAVAGWAGRAGHAHFVRGLSDPVAPGRERSRQCQGGQTHCRYGQRVNYNVLRKGLGATLQCSLNVKILSNKTVAAAASTLASLARLAVTSCCPSLRYLQNFSGLQAAMSAWFQKTYWLFQFCCLRGSFVSNS